MYEAEKVHRGAKGLCTLFAAKEHEVLQYAE
jgi:hypothetical protein